MVQSAVGIHAILGWWILQSESGVIEMWHDDFNFSWSFPLEDFFSFLFLRPSELSLSHLLSESQLMAALIFLALITVGFRKS